MTLYLVRHGKARKGGIDRKRPLTKRGIDQTRSIADFLRPRRLRLAEIWHSDRVRAIETARILAPVLCAKTMKQKSGLGPSDPLAPIIRRLKRLRGDLMIVGHLPFLHKLTSKLLTGSVSREIVHFTTSTIAALTYEDAQWRVEWVLTPQLY